MSATATADWIVSDGNITICGTHTVEHSRESMGDKWCFHCRRRHNFDWVVYAPEGFSYYDPHAAVEGVTPECSDLFPGWTRAWSED